MSMQVSVCPTLLKFKLLLILSRDIPFARIDAVKIMKHGVAKPRREEMNILYGS